MKATGRRGPQRRDAAPGRWVWSSVLGLSVFLVVAGAAVAQFATTEVQVTESLAHGSVNWTDGLAQSRGRATTPPRRGAMAAAGQAAAQAARQELLRLMGHIRLDAMQTLGQAIQQTAGRQQALETLLTQATIAATRYLPGGTVETAAQMPFAGPFMSLFLPAAASEALDGEARAEAAHTGVVIDARGLAIQPALFPHIVDERGQPLYTPAVVEREAAIQQGYIAYLKAFDQPPVLPRIGEHPLVVRALRVAGEARVDLVLNQAEASRLRDYPATRRLLRQCRVVIVM